MIKRQHNHLGLSRYSRHLKLLYTAQRYIGSKDRQTVAIEDPVVYNKNTQKYGISLKFTYTRCSYKYRIQY